MRKLKRERFLPMFPLVGVARSWSRHLLSVRSTGTRAAPTPWSETVSPSFLFPSRKQKNRRFYTIGHVTAGGGLQIRRDEEKMGLAVEMCGGHVPKTDRDMPADQLWRLHMTLHEAEGGFRMLKSCLGLRPNFHQKEDRVDGRVFISVFADHLLSWIRRRLDENGDRREWMTVRRILDTHSLAQFFGMLGVDWKRMCPATTTEIQSATAL